MDSLKRLGAEVGTVPSILRLPRVRSREAKRERDREIEREGEREKEVKKDRDRDKPNIWLDRQGISTPDMLDWWSRRKSLKHFAPSAERAEDEKGCRLGEEKSLTSEARENLSGWVIFWIFL
jgi:hypothetical protein